jgi:hypothetical protein
MHARNALFLGIDRLFQIDEKNILYAILIIIENRFFIGIDFQNLIYFIDLADYRR